jgi:hypothetical protein
MMGFRELCASCTREEIVFDTSKELYISLLTLYFTIVFDILFYRKISGLKKLSMPYMLKRYFCEKPRINN